ncbi:MAG: hypothetical protein U0003_03080 [Vampirovibrionales bacterium]
MRCNNKWLSGCCKRLIATWPRSAWGHLTGLHAAWEWEFTGPAAKAQGRWQLVVSLAHRQAGFHSQRLSLEAVAQLPNVSLADCEPVSGWLSDWLDACPETADWPYDLQVSSPGVFRRLTTLAECRFYVGWPVQVTQASKVQTAPVVGWIDSVSDDAVQVAFDAGEGQQILANQLLETTFLTLNPPLKKPER